MTEQEHKLSSSVFFIEANSFEQLALWKEHNKATGWVQDTVGFSLIVGHIDGKHAVNVCFTFATLYGQRICFYDVISRYVDFELVQDWIKEHYPVKYDNGQRWAMTDAMNFHTAVHHCKSLS